MHSLKFHVLPADLYTGERLMLGRTKWDVCVIMQMIETASLLLPCVHMTITAGEQTLWNRICVADDDGDR